MAAAGAIPLALTGANRRVNEFTVPLVVTGLGVFALGWFADLYGSAGGGSRGAVPQREGQHQLRAGIAYVYDPQFAYGPFAALDSQHLFGRTVLRPSLWVATSADNQRAHLELARRLIAPDATDGTRLEVAGRTTYHRYGDDAFWVASGELAVRGRIDLHHVGAPLAGSFADLGVGMGIERVHFTLQGVPGLASDYLLGEFAYGLYLGNRGEARFYYDHRRDDFAAGLSPGDRQGSGFAGHLGLDSHVWLARQVGLGADVQFGAATVMTLGVLLRSGEGR